MRIAMIIEAWKPIWGGGQAVAYEIGKRLSENYDVKIDLFVMNLVGYEGDNIEQINGNFRIIHVGKKRTWCFKDRILWTYEVIKEILNYHKKEKYDLIYAHAYLPGIPAKLLSVTLKIPICYHIHGANNLEIGKRNLISLVEKVLLTQIKYDLEFSVSKNFLKYKNVNKVKYIPNGVNVEIFEKGYKKFINNKNNNEFKILFVGRFDKVKGLHVLIKAIASLKNHLINKNAKFYLVGYGYDEDNLKNLIKKFDLENLIVFRGKLVGDDLIKEYVTSDLFVLPSLSEGFPLTVLEAWACKLPVLVTSVGELQYIIKEDYNGWLISPGSAKELSEKLKYVLNLDRKKLAEVGENGHESVKEKYNWDEIIKNIYDELTKVIRP
ncbi:MAG: hypothetical protein PWQ85_1212 [Geotoga sp.]|nr:hypothetical protein [Geotoga sp.]